MPDSHPTAPRWKLATLFFLSGAALGMWNVNFGNVLRTHGLEHIIGYAYACSGIAAFISPLAVGALADQAVSPLRLVRWLAMMTAGALVLMFTAIERGWGVGPVLALALVQAICAAPLFGLCTSIVMAELRDAGREFGPLRSLATFGWMAAGWIVSFVLNADASTVSGYAGAVAWIVTALFTYALPALPPTARTGPRDAFGFSALALFRDPNHRVVFLAAALYNIPMAAFYPFTPIHLTHLGVDHATAVMGIGQISELISMFLLAGLIARLRLKRVFLVGVGFGVLRFALCALDTKAWLIAGIALHGFAFTLFFITAQIYLEQRVDPAMRARAQALFSVMLTGVGSFIGFLSNGWWRNACATPLGTDWPRFWFGVSGAAALVGVWFAVSYRGRKSE
ncbi:MAG: MFS transporter [Chthoniobacteraceae bacterium]